MKRNIMILVVCGGLYWLNRLWLAGGTLQWFLQCYFSDLLAGLVLPALTSIFLLCAKCSPLQKWRHIALLLLAAGLVWECLAPLWKPGSIFDWWDFGAYQLGGLLYYLFQNCIHRRKNANN